MNRPLRATGHVHAGLVMGPGPLGRCDDHKVGIGTLFFDVVTNRRRLWYYCRDRQFSKGAAPTLGSGRIALATSRDGVSWERTTGPGASRSVMGPATDPDDFDGLHIGNTDVSFANGSYWLWYFGGNRVPAKTAEGDVSGLAMLPGLARSTDGISWRKVRGPGRGGALFDERPGDIFASWTNAAWDGRRFIMWDTATDAALEVFRTYVAYSADGAAWIQAGPITMAEGPRGFDGLGIMASHVQANPFQPGPRWLMLYTALDSAPDSTMKRSIATATSDDGIIWTRMFGSPIFQAGGRRRLGRRRHCGAATGGHQDRASPLLFWLPDLRPTSGPSQGCRPRHCEGE